jgi:hypothetical protein
MARKPQLSASKRGYDKRHRALRALWAKRIAAGGVVCARPGCGRPILPGMLWDLGHHDWDRTQYRGPEHRICNRKAAGQKRQLLARAAKRPKPWFSFVGDNSRRW